MLLVLFLTVSFCSLNSFCSKLISEKIRNKEYVAILTDYSYDLLFLYFDKEDVYLSKEENFYSESYKVGSLRNFEIFEAKVENVLKSCKAHVHVRKVIVYKKTDQMLVRNAESFISDLSKLRGSESKSLLFHKVVEKDSLLYKIMKNSPVNKDYIIKNTMGSSESARKQNSIFLSVPICLRKCTYILEIDLKKIFTYIFLGITTNEASHQPPQLEGSRHLNLLNVVNIMPSPISNICKLNMKNTNKIEIVNDLFKGKERRRLFKFEIHENAIFFRSSCNNFLYTTENPENIRKRGFFHSIATPPDFFEIDLKVLNDVKNIMKKIYKLKTENFEHEILFSRFINNYKSYDIIIQNILLDGGSAINLIFSHLCFELGLLTREELISLTKRKKLEERSKLKQLIIDNKIAEKLSFAMENVKNGIIYLLSLCLMINIEDKSKQREFYNFLYSKVDISKDYDIFQIFTELSDSKYSSPLFNALILIIDSLSTSVLNKMEGNI